MKTYNCRYCKYPIHASIEVCSRCWPKYKAEQCGVAKIFFGLFAFSNGLILLWLLRKML